MKTSIPTTKNPTKLFELEFVSGLLKGIKIREERPSDFPVGKVITPCAGSSKYIAREIV